MSDALFDADDGANTPLSPEERDGLIPTYITTRNELNDAEHANISDADRWAFTRKRDVLSQTFLRALHKRMFGKVWRWAGTFSQESNRRIGVDYWRIEVELGDLIDTVQYWIAHQTYAPDEIAVRFHHKLTWIHAFPNGNGRHARLAADLLAASLQQRPFTWGSVGLVGITSLRDRYVAALRTADAHDIGPLLAFARS